MDLKDQVAIHEAMEQQTISITKAGVKVVCSEGSVCENVAKIKVAYRTTNVCVCVCE